MHRYLSIDILRGVAIILMIQVHFVENLSPREHSSRLLFDTSMILGTLPAPFFTFLTGLSYSLWVRKQESLRCKDREITRGTLRRGLFLFGLGLAFNFCIWLPDETFNWDILTLIGTAMLVLAYARKLPLPILALIGAMVLLISPLLIVVGDYSSYWEDSAYTYDFTVRDVFFGFLVNGYFPVFPWIVFPLVGFICGDWLFLRPRRIALARRQIGILGIVLLVLAGLAIACGPRLPPLIAQHYASGLTEFPASTEFVLLMLGLILLSLVILNRWVDQRAEGARPGRWATIITRFSTFSLTVYIVHHMVILWPLWIYGVCMGRDDPTYYWRGAMSAPASFALAVLFIVACHFVLIRLERHKKYSLEALMRRF